VLITGASGGLGAAIAVEAARSGCHLALTARRADRLEGVVRHARAEGVEAIAIADDLADPEAPDRIVRAAIDHFGRLDVLVNNAAIGLFDLFADAEPADLRRQVEVNLVAPWMLAHRAIPSLADSRGMIVNVGSAITSVPNPGLGAYGATKAALAYWNDALRRELRDLGIRVCLVEPGPIATDFFAAAEAIPGSPYRPLVDRPLGVLNAPAEEVARRVVCLFDRPRRRISPWRRVVWPYRATGLLFRLVPWLGDVAVASLVRHHRRHAAPAPATPAGADPSRSLDDARSPR
jgi:short-subunit dehydrogenase